MTELDLYKFIEESGSSTRYDEETNKAVMWVYHSNIADFVKLIGNRLLDNGGLEVRLQEFRIAICMNEVCDYYGIDVENVFKNNS